MGHSKASGSPIPLRHLPILVGFLFLALFFNGCGGGGVTSGEAGGDGQPAGVVRFLNWKDFTDRSILSEFEQETGITVELSEYETNEEMIARVQSSPGEFDVIVVDVNLIPLMQELRVIEELNPALLPNLAGVEDKYRYQPLYDPEGEYGVPYLWGTTGMVINTAFVSPGTDSWDALWDSRNRERIGLLDDVRDGLMPIHLHAGIPVNTRDPAELAVAERSALELVKNGVVIGNTLDLMDRVIKGDLWLAEAYGGDVAYLAKGRDDIKYILPREGFGLWMDSFVVSSDARNQTAAHAFIDFLTQPEMSARSASTFFYGTPVGEAEALLGDWAGPEEGILLDAAVLSRAQMFIELGTENRIYQRIFSRMKLEASMAEGGGP